MRRLFDEGKSRKEVALLLGVGYGFVQNVYAKYTPNTSPIALSLKRAILFLTAASA